jgi:hypothetical protein
MSPPPIDAAEFDAQKNLGTIITQFLCRNKDKGFTAKEIAQAVGIREEDVTGAMLKMGLADAVNSVIKKPFAQRQFKIEDVTINGIMYYRCLKDDSQSTEETNRRK